MEEKRLLQIGDLFYHRHLTEYVYRVIQIDHYKRTYYVEQVFPEEEAGFPCHTPFENETNPATKIIKLINYNKIYQELF